MAAAEVDAAQRRLEALQAEKAALLEQVRMRQLIFEPQRLKQSTLIRRGRSQSERSSQLPSRPDDSCTRRRLVQFQSFFSYCCR